MPPIPGYEEVVESMAPSIEPEVPKSWRNAAESADVPQEKPGLPAPAG
jgi:hypothetical protein